ncbi:MAG TPA: (Fe-S)-binding protein [Chloroflexota bacterium]|nr:(Fe-S)-binding protein [Chloroflexota bacterium]
MAADGRDYYARYYGDLLVLADLLRDSPERAWLTNLPADAAPAEYVLYLGCNVLRTMHLAETVIDLMTYLGEDFATLGGPANCCGIGHARRGETVAGDRLTGSTLRKLNTFTPSKIVTWCPSCTFFLDKMIPAQRPDSAPLQHFSEFVVERMDRLRFVRPVRRRVALHAHTGTAQRDQDAAMVTRILEAIPGIERAELPALEALGRHCSASEIAGVGGRAPYLELVRQLMDQATAAGVDTVVTIYHSCQREICQEEGNYPFTIDNWVTLLGEALGLPPHEDRFKRYKLLADKDQILADLAPRLAERGIAREKAERAVVTHFVEQSVG